MHIQTNAQVKISPPPRGDTSMALLCWVQISQLSAHRVMICDQLVTYAPYIALVQRKFAPCQKHGHSTNAATKAGYTLCNFRGDFECAKLIITSCDWILNEKAELMIEVLTLYGAPPHMANLLTLTQIVLGFKYRIVDASLVCPAILSNSVFERPNIHWTILANFSNKWKLV